MSEDTSQTNILSDSSELNKKMYTFNEVKDLSDDQLLAILHESWNIENDKIIVWGQIRKNTYNDFCKLFDVKTKHDNQLITYPLSVKFNIDNGAFISDEYARKILKDKKEIWVECELELSPSKERVKYENPFLLRVKFSSVNPLVELPNIDKNDLIDNESSTLLSQAIYDFYIDTKQQDIELQELAMHKALDSRMIEARSRVDEVESILRISEQKHDDIQNISEILDKKVKQLSEQERTLLEDVSILKMNYKEIEMEMTKKLERLKSYIEDRAVLLKDLKFIDSEDFASLLLNEQDELQDEDMLTFDHDFSKDYSKAVSHIQAYLLSQDILYPRHVIENFFALIKTNDLIILAGDSGSGKTNLVQSFAKAIGGVSKIIPVKPNWTSSEDLLGYYNPLEKKYIVTPFLKALIKAKNNPKVPYLICLDEMNLARVEYYFADFLSKLEQRGETPKIELYSDDESAHILSELRNVISIINGAKDKYKKSNIVDFVQLLQDEEINAEIKRAFGFSDKDSLIKYHSDIRRMLSGTINTPSNIMFPPNVRIIGAINIDETTHYLSPKILDRAHIMKFKSPLLNDWEKIIGEIDGYDLDDVSRRIRFDIEDLGNREPYPKFDHEDKFCQLFVDMNRSHFSPMGVEFGLRTIRQGLNYCKIFSDFNPSYDAALNNFLLHKVLPKFTFDGNKEVGDIKKSDLLYGMVPMLEDAIDFNNIYSKEFSAKFELNNLIDKSVTNDWIVNYWS